MREKNYGLLLRIIIGVVFAGMLAIPVILDRSISRIG